jgi:hypothetical protein
MSRPWPDPDYPEKGDRRWQWRPVHSALAAVVVAALVAALLVWRR